MAEINLGVFRRERKRKEAREKRGAGSVGFVQLAAAPRGAETGDLQKVVMMRELQETKRLLYLLLAINVALFGFALGALVKYFIG